jgi:hypothetical protein
MPELCPENSGHIELPCRDYATALGSSEVEQPADAVTAQEHPAEAETCPLLVTVAEAQRLLSIGKSSVFAMLNDGDLERRKVRKGTRITMRSVLRVAGLG